MLLVEEVDNKEFLTKLVEAMHDELPSPKPKAKEGGSIISVHVNRTPKTEFYRTKIYDTGRFSAVLPQVQVYLRDPLQRQENGRNCAGKGIRI